MTWQQLPGSVTATFAAMGTEVAVILPSADAARADDVRDLFAEWEAALSRFRPASDLSRLNARSGSPVATREPLTGVLRQALRAAAATSGIFDPTLGSDLSDVGYARTFSSLRGEIDVQPPRPRRATWRDVRIGPLGVMIIPRGLCVDLGGIAKGMAVDAALARLLELGVESALVSAGGDLAVTGSPPERSTWPITVPAAGGETVVTLSHGALATSSTEKRRWQTAAGPMHHLLDPRTRRPADTDLVRVSVHAQSCETAEVAAKTALILGSAAGARFLEQHRLSGLLTTSDASVPVGAWPAPDMRAAA